MNWSIKFVKETNAREREREGEIDEKLHCK
jgi:hypothetical protein